MRKFQDFFVIQILREINFGESRNSNTDAVVAKFWALNFVILVSFILQNKMQEFMKIKMYSL